MSRLIPDLAVASVYDIDLDDLKARGIRAIITDLDNTLVRWDQPDATPELVQWLDDVRDTRGFQVCIVSNNENHRVETFARPLNVPFIAKAQKPKRSSFHKALEALGTRPEETAMIGDQMFTDVLGGNRMGLYTILVLPIAEKEYIGTKVLRLMEKVARSILKGRGLLPREHENRK